MVFKKDITPFAKGGTVRKHQGKGSSIPRPDPVGRMTGRYPKVTPLTASTSGTAGTAGSAHGDATGPGMSAADELSKKAHFLRNAAPQAYRDFYGAFAEYADAAAEILIRADENLQLYQGHAQQLRKLMQILEGTKHD